MIDSTVKAPCLNCQDRTPTCHDTCERFKKFRRPFDEAAKAREKERIISDYSSHSTYRHRHKKSKEIIAILSQR